MKTLFLGLCFLGNLVYVNASENNNTWIPCEKAYINPKAVHFEETAIYIHVGDDQWIQTAAVLSDNAGLYINSFKPTDAKCSWICEVCGKRNEGYRKVCKKCGEERPEYDD